MAKNEHQATLRVVFRGGEPYLESRFRAVDDTEDGPIPKGKILVLRAPIREEGADESEMERELIDDDGSVEAFCPECAAGGHDLEDMPFVAPAGTPFGGRRKSGRNDPCPCGSGRKYKRCCLN